MINKITNFFKTLDKEHKYNLIELAIAIILIIVALTIMNDLSFILFGLGVILIALILLKIINNK